MLTPELIQIAADLIADGAYAQNVAAALGVTERTWYNWKRRGREVLDREDQAQEAGRKPPKRTESEDLQVQFLQAVTHADAEIELEAVRRWKMAFPREHWVTVEEEVEDEDGEVHVVERQVLAEITGDWRAAMNFLERRFRERWGRQATLAVTTSDTVDELAERLQARMADPVMQREALQFYERLHGVDGLPDHLPGLDPANEIRPPAKPPKKLKAPRKRRKS